MSRVIVKPSVNARALDVPRTADRLLAAALRPTRRSAPMVVATKQPERTTAEARKMGITGLVSSYTTIYSGDANRVHNVRLVAELIDGTLIAPGTTFSFNATTGERNADKGFLEAPVIINGELQTGLGGGVCQVSTTVFNAAYEAGLDITERTNHALYISHYPQGRDATVNYPDLDLKFVNDTKKWLLLRTFVGSSALTVNLYGRRSTGASSRRSGAARRRQPADDVAQGPDDHEGPPRGRRRGLVAALDERQPEGLPRERHPPVRRHVVLVVPRREEDRPRRHEAEARARAGAEAEGRGRGSARRRDRAARRRDRAARRRGPGV